MLGRTTAHLFHRLANTGAGQVRLFGSTDVTRMLSSATTQTSSTTKWKTSYSAISFDEAEKRLGIQFDQIKMVSLEKMLGGEVDSKRYDGIKEVVYSRIIEYLNIEGLPGMSNDFKEANVSDLVLYTIGPILDAVCKMGRRIRLQREKELVSVDCVTGGREEFVIIDKIDVGEKKFVLIIETKRTSLHEGMKQILLSLKDARDNNGGGTVYGFVTTGELWQMLSYDGVLFQSTRKFLSLLEVMEEDKESWMKECSVIVDCMVAALENGGRVARKVVGRKDSS